MNSKIQRSLKWLNTKYYVLSVFCLLLIFYLIFIPRKIAFQAPILFLLLTIPVFIIQLGFKQLSIIDYVKEKFADSLKGSFKKGTFFLEYYLSKKVSYVKQPDDVLIEKLDDFRLLVNRILLSFSLFFLFLILTSLVR